MKNPKFTIITCTYNAESLIEETAKSIVNQEYDSFEWVVVDGASNDRTVDLIDKYSQRVDYFISEPDSGLYEALNKAVAASKGDYYLVLGAGDIIFQNSLSLFAKNSDNFTADLICASVRTSQGLIKSNRGSSWRRGAGAYISHHSVGTAIKRNTHDIFGLYSTNLYALSDNLYVQYLVNSGAKINYADFVSGDYRGGGISENDFDRINDEFFQVQISSGHHKYMQRLIYTARKISGRLRNGSY